MEPAAETGDAAAAQGRVFERSVFGRIERVVAPGGAPDSVAAAARERARSTAALAGGGEDGARAGAVTLAGELIAALALERSWPADELDQVLGECAAAAAMPRALFAAATFATALRGGSLLELPARAAATAQLELLAAFGPAREVSLWLEHDARAVCIAHVGAEAASRRVRAIAVETLAGRHAGDERGGVLHGVPVVQWDRPRGALVVRVHAEHRSRALAAAGETALALVPILEKESHERQARRRSAPADSSRRRLTRLGFDLHDGPLQDLAALRADLRLLRSQVGDAPREIVRGRVDDALGRVAAVETELRELARSLESSSTARTPFDRLIRNEVERASADGSLTISVRVTGDVDDCTPSQRMALHRLIEEALSNVKQHSGASRASVVVSAGARTIRAEVTDNGRGFDVDSALVDAARAGRLGLVGMSERIRLLDGRVDIVSRPGGPTSVSAAIPRWRPDAR